ncbi:MAG: hypothetical protein AB8B93_14755 [Pseudomonadales bacterium]
MNQAFAIAAGLSAALTLLHLIGGGRTIAQPLLASTALPRMPQVLMYFCWHITSIAIAFLAAAYGYAALTPGNQALAGAATLLCAAIAVLGIVMAKAMNMRYAVMPQGWLFLPIAIIGGYGLL